MAEPKTRPTGQPVDHFIESLEGEQVRADCRTLCRMMQDATGSPPEMWGTSIIGCGRYWWTGANGKKTEWMTIAFAPRKGHLTVYLWPEFEGRTELMSRLGKHSCGKGCVNIKRLADVDMSTLRELITRSVAHANGRGATA